MTSDDKSEKQRRHGAGADRGPAAVRPWTIGFLMLLWTALMTGWFLFLAGGGSLSTRALALAVGGLIGVVWLLGLLVLGLFVASSRE